MFNERKVAQMSAYLLSKGGGEYEHLKLMKLLYLSDRESLNQTGFSISNDFFVSMPHGPVLSQTLSLINGEFNEIEGGWDEWISDTANYKVSVRHKVDRNHLDELSDYDIEIMNQIWAKFGQMTVWEIRDYTHDHCAEWKDPHGSSMPIPTERIFLALGRDKDLAVELATEVDAHKQISCLFKH